MRNLQRGLCKDLHLPGLALCRIMIQDIFQNYWYLQDEDNAEQSVPNVLEMSFFFCNIGQTL